MLKTPHNAFKLLTYSMGSVFNEKVKKIKTVVIKELEIQKEMNYLIDTGKKDFILKFFNSGYILTEAQFHIMLQDKQEWFKHHEYKDIFDNYFVENHAQDIKKYTDNTINELKNTHFLKSLEKDQIFKIDKKVNTLKFIAYNFHELFKGDHELFHTAMNTLEKLQERLPKKQKKDEGYINMLDSHLKDCQQAWEKNYLVFTQDNLEKKIEETKELYQGADLLKNIARNFQMEIKNFNEKSFTNESWQLIQEIKSLDTTIDKKHLDEEQKWHIINIFEKKLPQACREYLGVSAEYREKLKTIDGKNAQDLLQDSLKELRDDLTHILESQQKQNLTQLNGTQRYISNTKLKTM